jgi:hypothetical protein
MASVVGGWELTSRLSHGSPRNSFSAAGACAAGLSDDYETQVNEHSGAAKNDRIKPIEEAAVAW